MAENIREIVLDTLLTMERENQYSNRLIKAVLDKYNYLDMRDKAFIKRVTEGTVERKIELDYYLNQFSSVPVKKMKPLMRCLLRMSVYQLIYMDAVPDSAVCNEACKLAVKRKFGTLKGFTNGVLRNIARNKDKLSLPDESENPVLYLSVKYSIPEWLVEHWMKEYGREIIPNILEGLLSIHPVSMRFRTDLSETEREGILAQLQRQGVVCKKSAYLDYVYELEHVDDLSRLAGFAEGKWTVQDISSALAVEAAMIRKEDFVVDVCAAPGGKSLMAAEKAKRVLSRDLTEEKAEKIRENRERLQADNVEIQVWDATIEDKELTGSADVVLMDVPCSGLGILGKKRDIKYHVGPKELRDLAELQKKIVRTCITYAKPGGTLIYSTCTINSGENEEMVRFLTEELGCSPVSLEEVLPEELIALKKEIEEKKKAAGIIDLVQLSEKQQKACIQLLPGYMNADGFFIAGFQKPLTNGSTNE